MPIKLHIVGTNNPNRKHYSCVSGQNHFAISTQHKLDGWSDIHTAKIENVEFAALRGPSDICSDVGLWPYLCEWTILTQCTSFNGG